MGRMWPTRTDEVRPAQPAIRISPSVNCLIHSAAAPSSKHGSVMREGREQKRGFFWVPLRNHVTIDALSPSLTPALRAPSRGWRPGLCPPFPNQSTGSMNISSRLLPNELTLKRQLVFKKARRETAKAGPTLPRYHPALTKSECLFFFFFPLWSCVGSILLM